MTRVAILDRHPAVRAGLHALLRSHPGLAFAGSAAHRRELLPLLYRTDPDVLLVDQLELVRRVKTEAPRTRVVLYVAEPSSELLLAAAVAGADGVLDKSAIRERAAVRAARRAGAAAGDAAGAGARGGAARSARPGDHGDAPGRHERA